MNPSIPCFDPFHLGGAGEDLFKLPPGTRVKLGGYTPAAVVWQTRRVVQVDQDLWSSVSDPVADRLRELEIQQRLVVLCLELRPPYWFTAGGTSSCGSTNPGPGPVNWPSPLRGVPASNLEAIPQGVT